MLNRKSQQVFVGTRGVVGADAGLIDLGVLGQLCEKRVQFLLIELENRLGRENTRVLCQNLEAIFHLGDSFILVLPIVQDRRDVFGVDIEELRYKLLVQVKIVLLVDFVSFGARAVVRRLVLTMVGVASVPWVQFLVAVVEGFLFEEVDWHLVGGEGISRHLLDV